jgi:hypothetical protein
VPKATSFSPLQVFSPVQLLFCLVLFFLPWIELSCTPPPEVTSGKAGQEEIAKFKKETGVDPTRPIGIVNQTGLQIATGKSSESSDFKKIMEAMKKEMGGAGGGLNVKEDPSKKDLDKAPFLYVYLLALVGGIVLGFVPWASPARKFLVLGLCLLALGVVGIQAAVGFPMEREMKKDVGKLKGGDPFGDPAASGKAGGNQQEVVKVKWKLPLYLTFLLLVGAAGTSMLGAVATPPRRKYRRPGYDDEDEDDDDRPRSRRSRQYEDDEDDEDDRPRRRRVEDDD